VHTNGINNRSQISMCDLFWCVNYFYNMFNGDSIYGTQCTLRIIAVYLLDTKLCDIQVHLIFNVKDGVNLYKCQLLCLEHSIWWAFFTKWLVCCDCKEFTTGRFLPLVCPLRTANHCSIKCIIKWFVHKLCAK
jgi:hypothetical protein